MATSIMAMRSTEAGLDPEARASTDVRVLTFNPERAPGRSADLITAETSEAFPLAGGRALQVASTEEVVPMVAVVDDITDRLYRQ